MKIIIFIKDYLKYLTHFVLRQIQKRHVIHYLQSLGNSEHETP